MRHWVVLFIGVSLLTLFLVVAVTGQQPVVIDTFTEAQAQRGKAVYDRTCDDCHLITLRGSGFSFPFSIKPGKI